MGSSFGELLTTFVPFQNSVECLHVTCFNPGSMLEPNHHSPNLPERRRNPPYYSAARRHRDRGAHAETHRHSAGSHKSTSRILSCQLNTALIQSTYLSFLPKNPTYGPFSPSIRTRSVLRRSSAFVVALQNIRRSDRTRSNQGRAHVTWTLWCKDT